LFVFNTKLTVYGSQDTLYLTECEHTAEQRVTCIVAMTALIHDAARLVGKGHTVVYAHGQLWILLFEDSAELNQVGTTAQVRGFSKVAIGEDVARTQVNEMGA
jgi:hypothetical protein